MTQQPAPPPDRGAVRSAVEALLRTCVDLEHQADDVARQSRERVGGVVGALAAVRLPRNVLDAPDLAQEIDGIGRHLDADLGRRLDEARQPYVAEIHALLGLLAPWHGLVALPPLAPAAPGAALGDHFPAGFAHDYVTDLLDSVDRSVTLSTDDAGHIDLLSQDDADVASDAAAAGLSAVHRAEAALHLKGGTSHATERHGPQLGPAAQLARLLWLKDPSGADLWQLTTTGAVTTSHRCGATSGGFTTVHALAKPLEAFLRHAHAHAASTDAFLDAHTPVSANRIGIHVSASLAGLVAGEVASYRGAGTGLPETRSDWVAARKWAMANGGPPVFGVPEDPIANGDDPGATLVFKRTSGGWRLLTCYPVDVPGPTNTRLEDMR